MKTLLIAHIAAWVVFIAASFIPAPDSDAGILAWSMATLVSFLTFFTCGIVFFWRLGNMSASNRRDFLRRLFRYVS